MSTKSGMGEAKGAVVVVGAGLVGALAAIYLAKENYTVRIYEKRAGNFQ